MKQRALILAAALMVSSSLLFGQGAKGPAAPAQTKMAPAANAKAGALSSQQKFVLDVVQSAVALPQSDQQDRLRVLAAAANIVAPLKPALARQFTKEGMRIEQDLIAIGKKPAVSILEAGQIDCKAAQSFVENIPDQQVAAAEQSLIAAESSCPKEALEAVRRKLENAMAQGVVAPRALLATIEQVGPKTAWAQDYFVKLVSNLPSDTEAARADAPNFAAMYDRMAPVVSKDAAQSTGVKMLLWLGKMKEGGPRNLAVNIVTGTMKSVLGEKAYDDALASDVMAREVAQTEGQPGDAERPEEESVSVLQAMDEKGTDRMPELEKMPPSLRAREAAASGFATGTSGDKKAATRYFDLAFSSLEDVWSDRNKIDAPAVIEEVSEAAAQVDPVDALKRAQRLQDPSASAIGMIAVARVVAGQQQQ
ncbi:MAG: hypothetical protein ROO76_06820 [Terriglobia bacterium]|nr:hypothetical protein [Terriglobia bacterium]